MDIKKLLIGITILVLCMVAFSDPIPIPHPAGSDSQVQYNNGGVFGGDSTFTFNDSTKVITGQTYNATDEDNIIQIDSITVLRTGTNANNNFFLGESVFNNDDGKYNTGLGYRAGYNNDTTGAGLEGEYNVYLGYDSGYGFTIGTKNTGYHNLFIGAWSGLYNTTGHHNSFIGSQAGYTNTAGNYDVYIGTESGYNATDASANSFIGYQSGFSNTWGYRNSNYGYRSAFYNQTGIENVSVGYLSAGFGNSAVSSHNYTTMIGSYSGYKLTTGNSGIYIGYKAGYNQTTASNLLIIDNQDRGSAAAELTNSLIYGVFNATVESQSFRLNVGEFRLASGTPYQILHNSTHEDTDGGRESRLNFKGEQSGGEESTLARIEAGHDGSADDQKGYIDFYTNDGSDGDTPTKALRIDSAQTVTGKLRSSDGVSGTLVMDDGTTEKITLVFTGGILTSRTVEATTSSTLMDWTD